MACAVPIFDFSVQAGDSVQLALAVKDDVGAAKSIIGSAIRFNMRKTNLPAITFEKTLADDVIITDGVGGLFTVDFAIGEITVAGAYTFGAEVSIAADSQTVIRGVMIVGPSLSPTT